MEEEIDPIENSPVDHFEFFTESLSEGLLQGYFPDELEGRPFWWYNGIMDYVEYF